MAMSSNEGSGESDSPEFSLFAYTRSRWMIMSMCGYGKFWQRGSTLNFFFYYSFSL